MSSGEFDPDALLARLQLAGPIRADEDGLETLHRAQAYTIPFENFDVLLGRGVNLDPAAVFAKLVRRPRGGYCFELNSLLLMALEYFGWQARPLLARVHLSGSPSGRGHMLLLVTLAGREWIADVGFGGPGLRGPLPFEIGYLSVQDGQAFRLVTAEPFGTMLQTQRDDDWQNLYSFDTSP
jgi:N-hydroxyarylamine O-acetyltransferase